MIPLVVLGSWVKGHHTGKNLEFQYDLNDTADDLATKYQHCQKAHFHSRCLPMATPNYAVHLLHNDTIITSKLYPTLVGSLHDPKLIAHTLKKTNQTHRIFQKVHWDVHEPAFHRKTRHKQCMLVKLIHGQASTYHQNHIFYGDSNQYPICHNAEETFEHILHCNHPTTAQLHHGQLVTLDKSLSNISTPAAVTRNIRYGFSTWLTPPASIRSPTAGSLFHHVGWYHFCLGRISTLWAKAIHAITPPTQQNWQLKHQAPLCIDASWTFLTVQCGNITTPSFMEIQWKPRPKSFSHSSTSSMTIIWYAYLKHLLHPSQVPPPFPPPLCTMPTTTLQSFAVLDTLCSRSHHYLHPPRYRRETPKSPFFSNNTAQRQVRQ